jgi:hypothetical protein
MVHVSCDLGNTSQGKENFNLQEHHHTSSILGLPSTRLEISDGFKDHVYHVSEIHSVLRRVSAVNLPSRGIFPTIAGANIYKFFFSVCQKDLQQELLSLIHQVVEEYIL